MSQPISPVRGTFLLAQSTLMATTGQWIIHGTLNQVTMPYEVGMAIPSIIIHGYVRAQMDQPGDYDLTLKLFDRSNPSNEREVWELDIPVKVANPLLPLETGFQLPILQLDSPAIGPEPGKPIGMHLTYWVRIRDHDLASADFRIILLHPDDYRHVAGAPPRREF